MIFVWFCLICLVTHCCCKVKRCPLHCFPFSLFPFFLSFHVSLFIWLNVKTSYCGFGLFPVLFCSFILPPSLPQWCLCFPVFDFPVCFHLLLLVLSCVCSLCSFLVSTCSLFLLSLPAFYLLDWWLKHMLLLFHQCLNMIHLEAVNISGSKSLYCVDSKSSRGILQFFYSVLHLNICGCRSLRLIWTIYHNVC